MNKKSVARRSKTVMVLLFFAASLIVVGLVLRNRIGVLLTSYTENQTSKRAQAFALLVEEKFNSEFDNLSYIASKLETSPKNVNDLMPRFYNRAGIRQGLLDIDGDALYGYSLDIYKYEGIQSSFRGEKVITFSEDDGLLLTCPVFHGSNIRYVLYRFYPQDTLGDQFSTEIYEDLGKICVSTRDGKIVVPFYDNDEEDLKWFRRKEIRDCFTSMHMEMEVSVAVARNVDTDRGEVLLFEAEIPGTDFLVTGYVPKSVAAEGIGNINLLVVWVFGLLMLLVMIGAIYLMRSRIKIRESDALREAKAVAEEASRAKSDFLANMSHEIRTPINAVMGMDEMILRESADESIITYANNIKTASNTLLGLINDILDFSKIEAGKIEIIPVEYDIASMINDLVNMIYTRADDKGLEMFLDFDPNLPRKLYGDEVRIKQVITNILTNAVKYTEEGSVTFHIGFDKNKLERDSIFLHVSVIDTGIGIREEDMDKLFSEFERIEEKRNRHIEGTGLGMTITKQMLELMGSSLKVESTYGEGSIFYFSLKQKVVDKEPLGDYEETYRRSIIERAAYHEKFTAPEAEVLVVDDNPMNLMVINSLLKQTLVQVDTAESGAECLKKSAEKKYDIIFLDHMMPDMDGVDTLRGLRADEGNPNVDTATVCLTANAISGAREQYIEEGFDDYLAKPIDPDMLEEMMMQYLPKEKLQAPSETEAAASEAGGESIIPDYIKDIDEINIDTGIKNYAGDEEAYLETLKVFSVSAGNYADEIRDYYNSGDISNTTIKIHALKSTLRIIGATDIGEFAQSLENAGKAGDTATLDAKLDELLNRSMSIAKALSPLADEPENPEEDDDALPIIDKNVLQGCLMRIRKYAEGRDDVGIEEILDELSEYRIPEEEKDRIARIRQAVDEFDFEAVEAAFE